MSRLKKIVRNIILLFIMSVIFIRMFSLSLNPIKAHEHSERSIHYGPSEIVKIVDYKDKKFILCKYDKWISVDTVNRVLGVFWRFGNQVTGIENDTSKPLCYSWIYHDNITKIYGIINDKSISKVVIELQYDDGQTVQMEETTFYDDMFLFLIDSKDTKKDFSLVSLKAYNKSGEEVFADNRQ